MVEEEGHHTMGKREHMGGSTGWGWSQGTGSRGKHGQEPLFWFLQKGLGKVGL